MTTWCSAVPSTRLGSVTDTAPHRGDRFDIAAPHRELLDQVLDKWSLAVLNELCERPARFSELRRAIPAVTQKSLTATLRRLERNGIVERVVLGTRPVAVEYRITALGKTLRPPVDIILNWIEAYLPSIEDARRRFDEAMDDEDGFGR
ncbi:helix-turn-helix transcriptional regulator [Microbacterium imperiale]|nr:helix-turn-helix transcriptional regulator [Microbacterium imperiale]